MRHFFDEEPITNQVTGVVNWRKENWINWFESPWGIIEKFHFANLSSSRDFLNLFGTKEVKCLKNTIGSKKKSLLTLLGIDDKELSKILGFSLKNYNQNMIEKLCKPLFDGNNNSYSYFNQDLMVCPLCIKGGYHSIIHQFIFTKKCPFHQVDLVNFNTLCKKPSCSGRKYELSGNKTINPFGCDCGSNWLGLIDSYKPNWYIPQIHEIKDDTFREWLNITEQTQTKKIFYLKRNNKPISAKNLITCIIEVFKDDSIKSHSQHVLIKSGKNIDKIPTVNSSLEIGINYNEFLTDLGPYEQHFNYIYETSKNTINAIARMIRKKIYFKHKNCLIRMKNHLKESIDHDDPFCPIAFSYLKWRQYIQGYNNIYEVDNYGKKMCKESERKLLDIELNLDKVWILYLFKSVKNQMIFYSPNNIQGLTWIFNRIIAHIVINHFNNILKYTITSWKGDHLFNFANHQYKNLETLLVKFPSKIGESYEFHVYRDSKMLELDSIHKYCQYQKIGKYKLRSSERQLPPEKVALVKVFY